MTDPAPALPSPTTATDPLLRSRVLTGIGELLPRVLGRELPELAENACLFDELGLTSASTLELILELEESLEIQIDVERIDQDALRSVASLADFVAANTVPEE
ncbi:phosphopantetheine-binding protein [Kitasatospora viridis]|uniref:Acyl carrier protein n=1 Tax=Kitasatospora viridis TaxID=281105 RepID=A0A561UPV4_9ACTN|nr:phosphopantetheine-binding protein [Kitasatospora viridis]TWG01364.1 acyl carrier protein [Kitasatospora viridis]